jgi:hypothetical protein
LALSATRKHPDANSRDANQIEIWKVKKLIKRLEAARGNGTSMISLIIRKSLTGPYPAITTATPPTLRDLGMQSS